MTPIHSLFVTGLYHARHADHHKAIDSKELLKDWCEENGYAGYTSYASLTDRTFPRHPTLAENSLICGL
ncbi:hypothetical protein [Litoreibacter halocynthiae]|uniref:hypothetical protein n=1 Tax=Litoreibacter halocynthiae TaxID=1242689 RepID=UPI0010625A6A|nr:hypothetical protein [Litoreibacter halocynthiae]